MREHEQRKGTNIKFKTTNSNKNTLPGKVMTSHLTNEKTQVQEFKLLAQIYIINKLQNQNLNTILSIRNTILSIFFLYNVMVTHLDSGV